MRMNFPKPAPVEAGRGSAVTDADCILGLEHPEFYLNLNAMRPLDRQGMDTRPLYRPGARSPRSHRRPHHQEQLPGNSAATSKAISRSPEMPRPRYRRSSTPAAG